MKHQTPDSIKFRKLARRLGLPRYCIAGLLEMLWITTQKNAPRGDIGRYDNETIAIELDWEGDPDLLVKSFLETGWVDEHPDPDVRLVIHDWPNHAPRYIHGVVARQGGFITERRQLQSPTVVDDCGAPQSATVVDDCIGVQPNLTKPNLTKPKTIAVALPPDDDGFSLAPEEPKPAPKPDPSPEPYPAEFEAFWSAYPANDRGRKRGKAKSHTIWKTIRKSDRPQVTGAAANYAREQTEFIRDPERFLKDDWWRDWVGEAKPRPDDGSTVSHTPVVSLEARRREIEAKRRESHTEASK